VPGRDLKWDSKERFLATRITMRPAEEVVEGETRPRERYCLHQVETPAR